MKQEYQKRFLFYCEYTNQNPEKADLTDYIIFISKMSTEYLKENNLDRITDHDDFTNFIENKVKGLPCPLK